LARKDCSFNNGFLRAAQQGRKHFFFEKKQQKTFIHFGFGFSGEAQPKLVKVFWFFFSKKNTLSY
jgi:hypothetical protein